MLLAYQVALCVVAVMLAVRLVAPRTAVVADLVVELGETRSGTLRDALANALGDPTLEIGYWSPSGEYVDVNGRSVHVPAGGGERAATFIERESRPFAVLVHDRSVLEEPALVDAVAAATRLSAANAALSADVQAQIDELAGSRRRLVLAADEERRRLEVRLHDGVERSVTSWLGGCAACRTVTARASTFGAPRSTWRTRSPTSARSPEACTPASSKAACPPRSPPSPNAARYPSSWSSTPGARHRRGHGGGLLRLRRGARQRRQARRRQPRALGGHGSRPADSTSTSPTTAPAALTRRRGRDCAGWSTGSRHSAGRSRCRARPEAERGWRPSFRSAAILVESSAQPIFVNG